MPCPVYAILHHPELLSSHSGMDALADVLGAIKIYYGLSWNRLQRRSWTLGQCLRLWGNWFYDSEWNALVPWIDEFGIRRRMRKGNSYVAHFLWAEFARPKRKKPYARRGARLVGTFHASARKQPTVIRSSKVFEVFDAITLMSQSQKAFFLERGVPEERLHVILHGVDTAFFTPGPEVRGEDGAPLRALLVGKTERDHEFAAELMRNVPPGVVELALCTSPDHAALYYRDVPNIRVQPWLTDEGLREAYQHADLLLMPLHDCAANNAVLEAMACGTPVMANRVGGIPEYVPEDAGILMDGKKVDDWIDVLRYFVTHRARLREKGRVARGRAEALAWEKIASQYRQLYEQLLQQAGN